MSQTIIKCGFQNIYADFFRGKYVSKGNNRIPLEPVFITSCRLTDIVIIRAPIVAGRKARYYLTTPQGDVRKLNISLPAYKLPQNPYNINTINVIFVNKTKIITDVNWEVFNVNFENPTARQLKKETFDDKEKKMEANDFMIGPMSEEDNGNWEVSAYYDNDEGELAEVSQVITLDITEIVPAVFHPLTLRPGDTLKLGFQYPILNVESCQLTVPRSTFDRFYDRDLAEPTTCSYVVRNLTPADSGLWVIVGVGRISYTATTELIVKYGRAESKKTFSRRSKSKQ